MKILFVTFSDNADHQDTTFGLFEQMYSDYDVWVMGIQNPKVPVMKTPKTWLVDCPKRPGLCKKTFDLISLSKILRRIRRETFDVIYFESLHVWNLPIMIFRDKHTHIYQSIHDLVPHSGDKQVKMVDLMNRAVCRFADTIIVHNRKYLQQIESLYKVTENEVVYLELWRRFPLETPPKRQKRVLFFGRINPYKGVDNLLQIVKQCPEIQFDIIGRVDPQMETIVAALKQEKNVFLNNDYVSDEKMKMAFINCDWVIVPYNSASQSGIIIDAYKYSRPVIAFDVGAIAEQVDNNESGYLVPTGNIAAFVRALKKAEQLSDEEYRGMCHYAYQYGSSKYAAVSAVKRFMKMIESDMAPSVK